jgi:hypothetical protein
MDYNNQGKYTQSMLQHRLRAKHKESGKVEIVDIGTSDAIRKIVVLNGLNCTEQDTIMRVIRPNPDNHVIRSDTDTQMIFHFTFKHPMDIPRIAIRADQLGVEDDSCAPPRLVKIFVNHENGDFTDFDDDEANPAATFELDDEKKLAGETYFDLEGHKFRKVEYLAVFFAHVELDEDDEEIAEQCFVNRIQIFGNVGKNYHTQYS